MQMPTEITHTVLTIRGIILLYSKAHSILYVCFITQTILFTLETLLFTIILKKCSYYDRYLLTKTKLKQGILRYCIKEKMRLQVIFYNSTQLSYFVSSYFECSSKSMDKICSLTLLAFFESFRRIAEHTSPVTTNTQKLILNIRLTSDEIVSQLLKRTQ